MTTGDWATRWVAVGALGEFVIAWVIYWELKANREAAFLEEAFGPKFYEDRRTIYFAFLGDDFDGRPQERSDLWQRSLKFTDQIQGDEKLQVLCQTQMTHLNKIALLYSRNFRFGNYGWIRHFKRRIKYSIGHDWLVEWLPNAVVLCWIILGPYILKRSSLIGHYWSAALIDFTLACVDFIDRDQNAQLAIYRDPKKPLIISKVVLSNVRGELQMLGKAHSRLDLERVIAALNSQYERKTT